ncbi:MAG TPA: cytochrome c [Xanthomonadaceae bacterium]|nr:cytochrome c [Xanthomonadaceae bacterium]
MLALAAWLPNPAAAGEGDIEQGRIKAYTCTGCHGIPGYKNVYPHYHVPKIGGQNYQYLVDALNQYRQGMRPHPTMRAQGESLSDQDIADIAAFLASLKEGGR